MQPCPLGRMHFLRPSCTLSAVTRVWSVTLFVALALIGWGEAQAATPVQGSITTDTTWTLAHSPYEVTGLLTVRENATLTLEPGVQVRVAEMTHFQVYGSLVAHGTESAPIRFSGATAQPGWWYGISVGYSQDDPAAVSLDHVVVEHAGYSQMESTGALDVGTASAEVRNSLFQNNGNNGVNLTLGGPVTVANTQFINNGWHAVRIYGYSATHDPQLSNLSASGSGQAGAGYDAVVYVSTHWAQGEHTLEAMGLPYVFKAGFDVERDGRLLMQPGIEVRVENGFYVRGELEAVGTAAQPITLTGIRKEPGGWWGLNVAATDIPATAHLEHVVLEYGGQTTYEDSANLTLSSSNLTLRNSVLRNGGGHGLYNSGGAPDETFAVEIENSQFTNNARAAVVCDDESCKQTASGLTATGNGINALVYRYTLRGDVTWKKAGIPYWVEGFCGISNGGTMTLEPGVEVRMAQDAWFDVAGALYAVGTAEEPIVFTGTQQQPGWWRGMRAAPNAIFELRYCDMGYGGQGGQVAHALIELATNSAVVSQCNLHHSGQAALRTLTNVAPLITHNRIDRTNAAGLINDNGTRFPLTVDARDNWWGDASGPAHATNPGGTGASVSDRVLFDPWLTSPDEQTTSNALEVRIAGVGRYTPGETVQYGIAYANPTATAVQDAVLRVALPANSSYVDSTGSAVYWPERRQLFWKLGTLAPGAGGLLALRVTYAWGLSEGIKTAILAELGGQGVGEPQFDPAEYLAYQPRVETGVTPLSAAQVQALRAADPKLDAVYDVAEASGYRFGVATERTYNTGETLTQVILLRVVNEDVQAFVIWRLPNSTVGLALDGSSVTIYKPGQAVRYDMQTQRWQPVAGGQVRAAADAIGWDDCMANCIEEKAPGEVAEEVVKAYGVVKKAVGCVEAVQGDDEAVLECSKIVEKAIPGYGVGVELGICNSDCKACEEGGQGCDDDKCHCCTHSKWRCESNSAIYGWFGFDVIMIHKCTEYGIYYWWAVETVCALCEKCVTDAAGVPHCTAKNSLAAQLGAAETVWVDEAVEPALAELTLVGGGGGQQCEECVRAKDPNAIHGPTGDLLPGQWVTYTVEYENVGEGPAFDVFIVNPLSQHFDLATLTVETTAEVATSLSTFNRTLYVAAGDLAPKGAPGAKGQVTYSVKLKEGLPSGTVIANQAVVHFPSVPEETPTNTAVNVIQPIAVPGQRLQVNAGQPLAITLSGKDASNAPLSFAVVNAPLYGTLAGNVPSLTYTPQSGFAGIDRLVYVASNGTSTSRQAEVVIEVLPAGNDSTRPTVKWTSPAQGAVVGSSHQLAIVDGSALYAPVIQVQFSEPMAAGSISAATVEVKNGVGQVVPVRVHYDPMLDQAVALMEQPGVMDATYTVTVKTGVTDLAGNGLAAAHTWSFRFGEGTGDAPTVYLPLIQQ